MAKTQVKGLSKSQGVVNVPYAAGWYSFDVSDVEQTQSKNGNDMVVAHLAIGDTYPEQPGKRKVEGKRYTHRFVLMAEHEFMVDRYKDWLNAGSVKVGSDDTVDPTKMKGKTIYGRMSLSKDKRDGTDRAEVTKWLSPEAFAEQGAGAEAADEDD